MLTSIYVKHFILIDEASIDLCKGLSAFTGETGAGKSLLMDAIGILKGDRANAGMVKKGFEKAIIEGVFEIEQESILQRLQADGYDMEEGLLIVTREINVSGKSLTRLNQRAASVSYVKEIIAALVDIHSQHDTQYLLDARYHLSLLDNFICADDLKKRVKEAYQSYRLANEELQSALHEDASPEELDYLTFQINEIDTAAIQDNELEALEHEQKRMASYGKISQGVQSALQELEDGCHPSLYEAIRHLRNLDHELEPHAEHLFDCYYQIEDVIGQLHEFTQQFEFDEEKSNAIQDRIFLLHKILRKYGGSYDTVKQKREELELKIDRILHRQDFILQQQEVVSKAKEIFLKNAQELRTIRKQKAEELAAMVCVQLRDLQLPYAQFQIAFQEIEGKETGIDQVEFLISMNAGEALKPLAQTASGGELSRLMLGLKTVFTSLMGLETIIFDEIDTGVSGKVALAIGKKMQTLAQQVQVFCVTHLAPVAACAKQHYIVEKEQSEDHTRTNIRLLAPEERVYELANIASGSTSIHALQSAKELLDSAQSK